MNLDDLDFIKRTDPQDMLAHIAGLPDQLQSAWSLGNTLDLPAWKNISRVIICGMGGSAIGADLVIAYVSSLCSVPVFLHRDYGLPAWASGTETLVICSSHSGNTEETLESLSAALERKCSILGITTGGKLAAHGKEKNFPVWKFEHSGQPRAAVGFSFGLLLAAFCKLGFIPDQSKEVASAVEAMKEQQKSLGPEVTVTSNPGKREAGQLMGRTTLIVGSGLLAPVARRWKGQLNELAKAAANFEALPEANHNTLQGLMFPEDLQLHTMAIFLRAPSDHPRNHLRVKKTKEAFMLEGLNTDFFTGKGNTPLAHMWTLLHLGDYISYYTAIAYGVDPTPIPMLESFKAMLNEQNDKMSGARS